MRIENAIHEVHGPQQAERRQNTEVRRKRQSGRAGDVVEISTAARSLGTKLTAELNSVSDVRQSRVEEVRQRVATGFYDRPEVREAIADAVLNSGVIDAVAQEAEEVREVKGFLAETSDVRQDRVEQARQRVATGFYDSVRPQIAEGMLNHLIG